jgi:nucleotide-binding universal stress UspA family protein
MFKKVLFPIDQNRETRDAVAIVSNIVKTYDSKLFLLSVVEKSADNSSVMSDEDSVAQLLIGAKELFAQEDISAEIIEREGMPSFTICDVADEVEANLIIMGCRGLGLTQEGVEDSVTNRVINLAPCPVLVVP